MCLAEITKDEPVTKGYKVFCNETETEISSPLFGKPIQKGVWVKAKTKNIYHSVKKTKTFSIFKKTISYNSNEIFYETGFHVFHTKETAEDYIKATLAFKEKLHTLPKLRSRNLIIKEVLVEDPICVGYQKFDNFSGIVTVARRIKVI